MAVTQVAKARSARTPLAACCCAGVPAADVAAAIGDLTQRTLSGSFTHRGSGGQNSFKFSGRLRSRTLAPGRHRLQAIARDAGANASLPQRSRFEITRRSAR